MHRLVVFCEALAEAGAVPHLADPAEVAARRGKKRRAKTDRADARHLRQLLAEARDVDFFHNCPHGRRVFRWWSRGEVGRWFDR